MLRKKNFESTRVNSTNPQPVIRDFRINSQKKISRTNNKTQGLIIKYRMIKLENEENDKRISIKKNEDQNWIKIHIK